MVYWKLKDGSLGLKKENDFDDDFAALQHPINILKNTDNTKGVITRIIPDSKH